MNFADLVKRKKIIHDVKGLGDDDLDVLTKALQKSKVLEKIYLTNNRITLSDDKFTDALARNRTLVVLSLDGNNIGIEGAKRLAAALKVNQTLQEISLYGNQIGDEGGKCFADALMVNKSLQVIALGDNNIGDEGAESLAASFVVNRSLRKIWLGGNIIGDKGAEKLATALKCNHVIEALYLLGNDISCNVRENIKGILGDPNRKIQHEQTFSLQQLKMIIAKKDKEIAAKDEEIASKNREIATKDEEITSNKEEIASKDEEIASKDEEIASLKLEQLEKFIAGKDEKIASLEADLTNSKPINDTVDLTSEDTEHRNKRPRTENSAKSNLAILHEENQKMVRVKKEKNAAETALNSVREETEAVEADLEEVRDDLGDANDLVQQQYLAQGLLAEKF